MLRRGLLVALGALMVVTAACGGSDDSPTPTPSASGLNTGPAPWPAPKDALTWIEKSGLPALPGERLDYHVHAHLDVFVDGRKHPVAANIGIDARRRVISPLHTHDTTGIIHIENDAPAAFTLGQLFTEWAVRLDDSCVGGYCKPEKTWDVFVNGQKSAGGVRELVLNSHDQLALVIGSPPEKIPDFFDFPDGF